MKAESGVPLGEKAFSPFAAEKLLANKIGEDLTAEELCQPRVVDPADLMEDPSLAHPALGQQKMEVGGGD
jgi:hypothetical protein